MNTDHPNPLAAARRPTDTATLDKARRLLEGPSPPGLTAHDAPADLKPAADLAAARPGPGDPDAGARRPAPVLHGHAAAIAAAEAAGDWRLASRLKADGLIARTLGHPDIHF